MKKHKRRLRALRRLQLTLENPDHQYRSEDGKHKAQACLNALKAKIPPSMLRDFQEIAR